MPKPSKVILICDFCGRLHRPTDQHVCTVPLPDPVDVTHRNGWVPPLENVTD